MNDPVLSVQSVSTGYGKKRVVQNVSFDIQKGEVLGLIGLNGVGKTTLIKTIIGLREKQEGSILVKKEDISYLPERFDPPWFLTGYNFIRFSLRLYKKDISLDEAKKQAQLVSLDPDSLTRRVHTYSKGMRQKLGLLATVLTDSRLLILDEPMSGLDPKARQEVKKIISDTKKAGKSVFMSSHILADVSELCDKIAVFNDRSIVFYGTADELRKEGNNDNLEVAFLHVIGAG
ncbi:MAG TPA: ABC transporter ATP-binding protein [Alphaproteobacteria bacterium]|nr:ABC transporter ATP-binding protein [Alphaproteobacteria bacterium]